MELFKLFGTIAITNADANEAIDDTTDKAEESEGKISSAFKKIGMAVATHFAVDKIKDFGMNCINAAADASAASSQFTQVFGDMEGKASKSLKGIADNTGIQVNRMKGSYTQIAAFAKTTGMDTKDALGLADRAMVAVADSAAFYDRSLEETTESLQSFLKGNFENDAALGLSCTETTRNAAANKLYGKSFIELSESQKQLTLLQMVEDANELSGALGQAARESDTWTNQTGNLQQAWTDFKAVIGENFLDIAIQGVKKVSEVVYNLAEKVPIAVEKFQAFKDKASEVGNYVADTLQPIFTDVKSVFDGVKSAVQPLIDKFSEYASSGELAEDVTNGIKDAADLLVDAYESIKTFISDVVQGFKDVVAWGREHETAMSMIAVAIGTVTTAIGAYNAAMALKKAGGIVEIAQLGLLKVQLAALTVAETAHAVATNIATAATSAFGAVMAFVTSPITLVVAAIGALIAIGVLLYKNWDTIKEKCAQLWSNVTEKFSNLKEAVVGKVTELKDKAVEKFQSMKNSASEKFEAMKQAASTKFESMKQAASEKFQSMKEKMGTIMQAAKDTVSEKLSNMKNAYNEHGGGIKGIASAAMEGVKGYYSAGYTFIDNLTGGKLSAVASKFKSKMSEAKNAVSEKFSGIKSSFSSGLSSAFNTVSSKLSSIKSKFSSIMDSAKSIVSGAISKIKGFFNFSWSLPKIKLPHFSISGSFSLNPPSIPHFSVSWYKKAMEEPYMFTKPTIFDVNPVTGQARGAGDAGDEVMIGKETMLNMIRQAVAAENAAMLERFDLLISLLGEFFPKVLEKMNRPVVLESGVLVGELAPEIDAALGKILNLKGRGN